MTTAMAQQGSRAISKPRVNKTYRYDVNGVRQIFRGAGAWLPENDNEFLTRFCSGKDVDLLDLSQTIRLHPVIKELTGNGMDYEAAIEGTVQGASYRSLFKNSGFGSWSTFRAMTEFECPGLKAMFNLALALREDYRLERAEEALRERAIDGVEEPVFAPSGKYVGKRRKFSDKLLEIHLRALDPDKYSDKKQLDVKGLVLSVNMGLRDDNATGNRPPPEIQEDLDDADAIYEEIIDESD